MYKVNSFLKKKKDPYLYLHITGQFAQKMTVHRQPFNMVQ